MSALEHGNTTYPRKDGNLIPLELAWYPRTKKPLKQKAFYILEV